MTRRKRWCGSNACGGLLLEQNDEWAGQCRYMTLETLAAVGDTDLVSLPAVAV